MVSAVFSFLVQIFSKKKNDKAISGHKTDSSQKEENTSNFHTIKPVRKVTYRS